MKETVLRRDCGFRFFLACLLAFLFAAEALAQVNDGRFPIEKRRHRALDTELSLLAEMGPSEPELARDRAAAKGLLVQTDSIAVSVRFRGGSEPIVAALGRLRGDVRNVATGVVEAYVPVASLDPLDTLRGVLAVEPIRPPGLPFSQRTRR